MPLGLGKNRVTGTGLTSANVKLLPKGQVGAFPGRARHEGCEKTQSECIQRHRDKDSKRLGGGGGCSGEQQGARNQSSERRGEGTKTLKSHT